MLRFERARWTAWVEQGPKGCVDLLTLRGKTRSDKYPDEWRTFVVEHWKDPDVTRRSEKARDTYRDKDDWASKKIVNKYLLETRQGVALQKIHDAAAAKFVPDFKYSDGEQRDFKMSLEFIRSLRPYNVKSTFGDRDTSLCRYHMQ